jgi:hypothetical protein
MDSRRFTKIKTLNDIKLEKARLRYELLTIENRLTENLQSIESMASVSSVFSRISYGFEVANNVYQRISDLIAKFRSWRKKKKKKKHTQEQE